MTDHPGGEAAQRRARAVLASGAVAAPPGEVGEALVVVEPNGRFHSWFVPLVSGETIEGFFELAQDLTLLRFSRFGSPVAADLWIRPARVREKAGERTVPGEELGDPVLTYDASPERLAWAVPASAPDGSVRTIFVAGESVYPARSGESDQPTFG